MPHRCLPRPAAALVQPRAPGQFRYPHFFILGFPKCATTSLYCHLIQHPQVQYPQHKVGARLEAADVWECLLLSWCSLPAL